MWRRCGIWGSLILLVRVERKRESGGERGRESAMMVANRGDGEEMDGGRMNMICERTDSGHEVRNR